MRERRLAYVILGFLAVACVAFFGYQFYLVPMKAKTQQIAVLQDEIDDLTIKRQKIFSEKKRLEAMAKLSLPHTPDTKADADITRKTQLASREYTGLMTQLLADSGFAAGSRNVVPKAPDNKTAPPLAKSKPAYTRLDFVIDARGDMASIVAWMEKFYKVRLLHQIKNMTVSRPMSTERGSKTNDLEFKVTIEALVLDGAEQRATLEPAKPPALPPVLAPGREYARIAGKDIFYGPPPPPPTVRQEFTPPPVFNNPSPYMKLDGIWKDEQGEWASLWDSFNNHHYEIRPRAAGDGFRVAVYYYVNQHKRELRSGKAIELVDENGDPRITWSVIKFVPEGLVLQYGPDKKYYLLRMGQVLQDLDPPAKPLTSAELAKYGVKEEKPAAPVRPTGRDRGKDER